MGRKKGEGYGYGGKTGTVICRKIRMGEGFGWRKQGRVMGGKRGMVKGGEKGGGL
jgi:hypothetical protein